jgi:hypothetical protein
VPQHGRNDDAGRDDSSNGAGDRGTRELAIAAQWRERAEPAIWSEAFRPPGSVDKFLAYGLPGRGRSHFRCGNSWLSAFAPFNREIPLADVLTGRLGFRSRITLASGVANAEIMLRVLIVTFRGNSIIGSRRFPRENEITLAHLRGATSNVVAGATAVEGLRVLRRPRMRLGRAVAAEPVAGTLIGS